jgi:Asp/Glu/hydantoin racemase
VKDFDGFLVACYSAHPLITMLREITDKPVIGIFEASVYHALSLLPGDGRLGDKFGIVTTGKAWEELLSQAVEALLGGKGRFAGVESTGLDADQLHTVPKEELDRRMKEATKRLVQTCEVGVVCLGCAGMVGMKEFVEQSAKQAGRPVRVVDGVEAGVAVLFGMLGRYLNETAWMSCCKSGSCRVGGCK